MLEDFEPEIQSETTSKTHPTAIQPNVSFVFFYTGEKPSSFLNRELKGSQS